VHHTHRPTAQRNPQPVSHSLSQPTVYEKKSKNPSAFINKDAVAGKITEKTAPKTIAIVATPPTPAKLALQLPVRHQLKLTFDKKPEHENITLQESNPKLNNAPKIEMPISLSAPNKPVLPSAGDVPQPAQDETPLPPPQDTAEASLPIPAVEDKDDKTVLAVTPPANAIKDVPETKADALIVETVTDKEEDEKDEDEKDEESRNGKRNTRSTGRRSGFPNRRAPNMGLWNNRGRGFGRSPIWARNMTKRPSFANPSWENRYAPAFPGSNHETGRLSQEAPRFFGAPFKTPFKAPDFSKPDFSKPDSSETTPDFSSKEARHFSNAPSFGSAFRYRMPSRRR